MDWQERTKLLIGEEKQTILSNSHVLIVGLGGVGAYAAEQLARAGIGKLTIVDGDSIQPSNRNRQLLALLENEGKAKSDLMKERLLQINPNLEVIAIQEYLQNERLDEIVSQKYDFIVDAIDTLAPKIFLIYAALKSGNKLVSSMGAGGKIDPAKIQIADLSKSFNDKLARILRKRLHKLGIFKGFPVVFSSEQVHPKSVIFVEGEANKKTTVGTISYMPALFGLHMASVVIRELIDLPMELA
ncbi:MAG: tRNA threonylcarbamoyladenosine dehydratase [Bacteroidales bacterium]|nr:tRNA threonylcarbamoyladenosine dehydratase [Bacteroidales bacterium]